MISIKDLETEKLYELVLTAYNNAGDNVDLFIAERTQDYVDLGYSNDEATSKILSKYRDIAESDNSGVIKAIGKYTALYNDFIDYGEFNWDDFLEKCARFITDSVLKSTNIHEFDNEQQIIKFFEEKIQCFEIINRVTIKQPANSTIDQEEMQTTVNEVVIIPNNETLCKMLIFNVKDKFFEYLDDLAKAFDFKNISDIDFNAICSVLSDKGVFKKNYTFTNIVKAIAEYYGITPPKESKPGKVKLRKEEFTYKYSVLERQIN